MKRSIHPPSTFKAVASSSDSPSVSPLGARRYVFRRSVPEASTTENEETGRDSEQRRKTFRETVISRVRTILQRLRHLKVFMSFLLSFLSLMIILQLNKSSRTTFVLKLSPELPVESKSTITRRQSISTRLTVSRCIRIPMDLELPSERNDPYGSTTPRRYGKNLYSYM
jgi:hypothetical protein